MKIAQINMTNQGSTGKIMLQIAQCVRNQGYEAVTYSTHRWGKGKFQKLQSAPDGHIYYGTYFENFIHSLLGKLFAANGCFSYFATKRLVYKIKKYAPDVIHLHNLHGFCINLPIIFKYIKKNNVKVVWTLHDCWAFTGHCPHFVLSKCDKWKNQCYDCPSVKGYPKVYWDNSSRMYKLKKKWFCGAENMTIVTPSEWLANLVKQSFLRDYPVKVINNGIDLQIFKPMDSDFRKNNGLEGKKVVIGVAYSWGYSKGLDVFIELSKRLPDDYRIVLVGTDDNVDASLPDKIIPIHRTQNQTELAEIYSAADVFVNATREDTFPTVNLESLACGTPVITFRTGGSPECIDTSCGDVVEVDDIDTLEKKIIIVCEEKNYSQNACTARAEKFNKLDRFLEYVNLYKSIANG